MTGRITNISGPANMAASDWDAYWRNAQSAAAHKDGGPQDVALEQFWSQLFGEVFPTLQAEPSMLDIACGNGAVGRFALAAVQTLEREINLHIFGLDESPAALAEMRKRYPLLHGIAAHGALLPFQDEAFDLVTSQFGVEYAGPNPFAEMARIAVPGGMIAAVLHLRGGGIYKECAINLEAIDGIRHSNLLSRFEDIFKSAFAVQQGHAGKALFHDADKTFAKAVAAAELVFKRWGKGVADGLLFRIYSDIAYMYRRFAAYDPNEVFNWINLMAKELDTYSGRMAAMLEASLDAEDIDRAITDLRARDFNIRRHDTLTMGRQLLPAAWVVVAERPKR